MFFFLLKSIFVFKVQKQCAGGNLLGVNFCVEGQVPDLATMSLQQIPAFPNVDQTKLYLTMAPTEDKPKSIQFTSHVNSNDDKGKRTSHCS